MRFLLTALLIVAATGCASRDKHPVVTDPDLIADATPTVEPNGQEPAAQVAYQCESGQTILASYPADDTAVVEYDDQTFRMEIAVSGSGTRYVGGELEWWTEGADRGTLFRHNADGTSRDLVETCTVSA